MTTDQLNAWVITHCDLVRLPDGTFGPWPVEGPGRINLGDGYQSHLDFVRRCAAERLTK